MSVFYIYIVCVYIYIYIYIYIYKKLWASFLLKWWLSWHQLPSRSHRFINARRRILQPMLDASNPDPAPKAKKMKSQHRPTQRFWPDSIVAGVLQTHRSQTGNNSYSMSAPTFLQKKKKKNTHRHTNNIPWLPRLFLLFNCMHDVCILTTRCHYWPFHFITQEHLKAKVSNYGIKSAREIWACI